MRKIRAILTPFCVVLVMAALATTVSTSQSPEGLSGTRALDYVRVLTGPEFESRMAGLPGGAKAASWIADRFKAWGLEPAGTNGYFQDFKKSVSHVESASFAIEAENTRRTLAYDEEWQVPAYSGSAAVRGELVFAGYGIANEKIPWNDFAGLDLEGRIVLIIAYGAPTFLANRLGDEAMPEAKIAKAYELGARAVVLMNAPVDVLTGYQRYPFPAGVMLEPKNFRADLAVAGINNDAVKAIFRNTGIDLYTRVQQMEKDKTPASAALGIMGEIDIRMVYLAEAPLRNVLAKITGSDRALRGECIVIGAHYDGLGMTADGRQNPGADDNASGTAVVMEIARAAMRAEKAKPKRTVVFALWDGEEQGLWGSVHYGQHPVFPMDKTIANLNLDMVGNGDGGLQFRGDYYAPEIWEKLKTSLPPDVLKGVVPTRGGPGGSDHTPFLASGVPGFFIQTTGAHYGRHDVGDMAGLVDPALLEKAGVFTKAAAEVLAGAKDIKPRTDGRERNLLRSSTIVDLAPRDASALLKEAEAVTYPDLDFALVGVAGQTPTELAKSFFDLTAAVQASKKAVLYQAPTSGFSVQRFGDRVGLLPGVVSIASFGGHDAVLRLMGKAGLGFIIIRDPDFAREEEVRRMIAAANAEGVLVIAWDTEAARTAKLVEWSARPGLWVTASPDPEVLKKVALKRWRLALDWKDGSSPEEYAAGIQNIKQSVPGLRLLVTGPGLTVEGFSPDLLKLAKLLAPKEMSESQIMGGGLDELGQNFITLLRELRPPVF